MAESGGNRPAAAGDPFSLSRWSRLKRGADVAAPTPVDGALAAPSPSEAKTSLASEPAAARVAAAADPGELALPPLSSISLTEDFTPFMQAKVPQLLRQQALKALFKEPHFNVMDGLDTYIDDYTHFEPVPPDVLERLSSWQAIKNPMQQVVTPGGYAVDVESEEGKAVLAARARAAEASPGAGADAPDGTADQDSTLATAAEPTADIDNDAHAAGESTPAEAPAVIPAPTHARQGRRVGDFAAHQFTADDAALSAASTAADAEIPKP